MDFIAKHALGPFKFCEYDNASVCDRYGVLICECCGSDTSSGENNAKLFAQTHAMRDYMIKRAIFIDRTKGFVSDAIRKIEREELEIILSILNDAWVEVVVK